MSRRKKQCRWIGIAFLTAVAWIRPSGASQNPVELGAQLQVLSLTSDTWLHISIVEQDEYGPISANGLLFVSGKEAALIDTPWTQEQTGLLFDWVERELGAAVTAVVPSHSHEDCIGGLREAHRRGARSYSLSLTQRFAREEEDEVPQNGFDDSLSLNLGSEVLDLRFLGAGHTRDNIVVWIPSQGVLFGGCLVKHGRSRHMGYIAEADLEAWPETLKKLREQLPEAEIIVPGHGSPGGWEIVDHTRKMIRQHLLQDRR